MGVSQSKSHVPGFGRSRRKSSVGSAVDFGEDELSFEMPKMKKNQLGLLKLSPEDER